ncbi:MAG: hypothetical protein ACYTGH_01165 [Planctomycetota bacterium]|jgi:hypothetical protein
MELIFFSGFLAGNASNTYYRKNLTDGPFDIHSKVDGALIYKRWGSPQ